MLPDADENECDSEEELECNQSVYEAEPDGTQPNRKDEGENAVDRGEDCNELKQAGDSARFGKSRDDQRIEQRDDETEKKDNAVDPDDLRGDVCGDRGTEDEEVQQRPGFCPGIGDVENTANRGQGKQEKYTNRDGEVGSIQVPKAEYVDHAEKLQDRDEEAGEGSCDDRGGGRYAERHTCISDAGDDNGIGRSVITSWWIL